MDVPQGDTTQIDFRKDDNRVTVFRSQSCNVLICCFNNLNLASFGVDFLFYSLECIFNYSFISDTCKRNLYRSKLTSRAKSLQGCSTGNLSPENQQRRALRHLNMLGIVIVYLLLTWVPISARHRTKSEFLGEYLENKITTQYQLL
jgi:hypothetical protein